MTPGPLGADVEFLDSAGRGFRVMQGLLVEHNPEFAQKFFQARGSKRQSREFHSILINIPDYGLFAVDDDPPQGFEVADLVTEKLNQPRRVFYRTCVDDHREQSNQ